MTQVYLGGGGSEHDEGGLWDEAFASGDHVAVWPFATPAGAARTATVRWLTAALGARGLVTTDVWDDESQVDDLARLRRSDVLAIPGGNTFALLHHLQQRGLLDVLDQFLALGGRVYGGSAGAVLLGADIAIADGVDRDDAGVTDTRGLDRLAGAVVRPHAEPDLLEELARWAARHQRDVVALPERGGLVVADGRARAVGPACVHVLTPTGGQTFRPGESWSLT